MKLKKTSAVFSLLAVLFLVAHIGYSVYAYWTFAYDPTLTKVFSLPMLACACIHGVLSTCAVFLLGDGTRAELYPGFNRRTVVQRVSAALIFPLLIAHLKTFSLLQEFSGAGQWALFAAVLLVQVCFYADVLLHAALSVSRALITLGVLKDPKTKKRLDRAALAVAVLLFAAASFVIVKTQLAMFVH